MPNRDVTLLMELSRALVAVAVRSLGAIDGEVPLPQFRALAVLHRTGPCNASELAEAVGLHVSTITRICDRLVRSGLITREIQPGNRREVELAITRAGSALVEQVWSERATELSSALRRMSAAERAGLRAALPALIAGLSDSTERFEHALG